MLSFPIVTRLAVAGLCGGLVLVNVPAARGETFAVDPVHSSMLFRVKHLNTSFIYGRFNEFSGTVNLDEGDPSFAMQIKVDSVDTANAKRDQHLKGPDFFSAKQFPTISFESTGVEKLGPTTFDVEGTLTLHGVSKPIKVRVDQTGTGKAPTGGKIAGISTTFTIKRSEFGMDYGLQGVSDEVLVIASLECAAK